MDCPEFHECGDEVGLEGWADIGDRSNGPIRRSLGDGTPKRGCWFDGDWGRRWSNGCWRTTS